MPHGSQVQIRSNNWSTWWYPADLVNWLNSTASSVFASNTTAPPVTTFLVVQRVTATQVQFLTPSGTWLRAGPPNAAVTQSSTYGAIDYTTDPSDPATVFTIEPIGWKPFTVHIRAYDGLYISTGDGPLLRWTTNPSSWEEFDVREVMTVPAIRGVNIGSWLVYEKWMDQGAYANPPVWKDGTSVQIMSIVTGYWISMQPGTQPITCNRAGGPTQNESFSMRRQNYTSGYWQFRSQSSGSFGFWSMEDGNGTYVVADQPTPGTEGFENFQLKFSPTNPSVVLILAPNGNYLQASWAGNLTADFPPSGLSLADPTTWGKAAFQINSAGTTSGEWQLSTANGGGAAAAAAKAARARAFLAEADWVYMAAQGINAARITVGYWAGQGAAPDAPFPSVDAAFLDWAMQMGAKYGVRVWLSMHAAPGSQNGWDHSAARDMLPGFYTQAGAVDELVAAVGWLAARYANSSAFLGIGLLNEPVYEADATTPLSVLQSYYSRAYDAVRASSTCAFLSMMWRIGSNPWNDVMWLMLDDYHTNTILEGHNYDAFSSGAWPTPAAEIAALNASQPQNLKDLQYYTTYAGVNRPMLIGEWCNCMGADGATSADVVQFATTQMQAYSNAQAGWFFWSLKMQNDSGDPQWQWYQSAALGWLPQKSGGGWW